MVETNFPSRHIWRLLILAASAVFFSGFTAGAQNSPVGRWVGRATYEGDVLPFEIEFDRVGTGLRGTFTSPTQKAHRHPLRNVVVAASNLTFDVPSDLGNFPFTGAIRGNALTGTWRLFGVVAAVSMNRAAPITTPYGRESVTCRNGDVSLSGTLLVPNHRGPHPALVFLHGSGSETRDASSFFADLFARQGFTSLTFDKRGAGQSTGDWRQADFKTLAEDVNACVHVLTARTDIQKNKIGLIGASQAGWIAPLAASLTSDVAFIALTSGPAVPVWQEGWWGTNFRLRQSGAGPAETEKALSILRLNDEVTRTGNGVAELQKALDGARSAPWFSVLPMKEAMPANTPFRQFYRKIIDFDPQPILEHLTIPSLWIYGDKDAEQPAEVSAAFLESLRVRGQNVTIRIFAGADHALFVSADQSQSLRWPRLARGYVDALTTWVRSQR